MNRGMTAEPSFDSEGNFVGVDVSSGPKPLNRSGIAPQGFATDERTGETYIFEEKSSDDTYSQKMDNDYIQGIVDTTPGLNQALAYAASAWSPERLAEHERLIHSSNYDDVNKAVEMLMDEYSTAQTSAAPASNENKPEEKEEVEDIPDVAPLFEQERDTDLAEQWGTYARESDGVYSLLASLSQQFHSGVADPDELIQKALDSEYSKEELITAYRYLSNNN